MLSFISIVFKYVDQLTPSLVHSLSSGKHAFLGQGLEVSWLVLEEDGQRLDPDLPTRAEEQRKDRLGSVRRLSKKFAFKSLLDCSSIRLNFC